MPLDLCIGIGLDSGGRAGFNPASLFAGTLGALYDPSDISTLFQDSAGTTPVTATGQPVGKMLDKSGNGNHVLQATAGKRPVYTVVGGLSYLLFDGVDDGLSVVIGAMPQPSTMFAAFRLTATGTNGNVMDASDSASTATRRNLMGVRSAQIVGYAGAVVNIVAEDSTLDHVVRVQFGASDALQNDNDTVITTDTGAGAPQAGDTLAIGNCAGSLSEPGPIRFHGGLYINKALSTNETNQTRTWLAAKQGRAL